MIETAAVGAGGVMRGHLIHLAEGVREVGLLLPASVVGLSTVWAGMRIVRPL